ncbi:unnamed protein product [Camellia sinensis]
MHGLVATLPDLDAYMPLHLHDLYYDVPEAKKVKLVSQSLKGRASNWWKQLQVGRRRNSQEKIREWRKMRKKFKEHFLPSNHVPSLLVEKQHKKGISSSGHQCQRQHKKGILSSDHQCKSNFATGQPSYDYFQVGCSTSVRVQETFDEGYHLKMLFSGEVVEPRYDEEKASIFGEEDMEENCGQEQDCSQALSVCDENFPVFDQYNEPDHDQDVAIFDDNSEVLAYEEVDNNTVSVANILGGSSDNTGSSIARRLVLKTGLNVILACNIPKNSPMLEADAEKKLVEKLIDLGYTRPKSNRSSS